MNNKIISITFMLIAFVGMKANAQYGWSDGEKIVPAAPTVNIEADAVVAQEPVYETDVNNAEAFAAVNDPSNRKVYTNEKFDKKSYFIVISKKDASEISEQKLKVYAKKGADTILVAEYPVCVGANIGHKTKRGDRKTPSSYPGKPFTITQIQDASTWRHDFKDGRGNRLAYGHWFLRLSFGSGIGIHGSTGNEWSIPGSTRAVPAGRTRGRDSEGCIRLHDEDIKHLHDNYAYIGMTVIITPETQGLLDFELKARQ